MVRVLRIVAAASVAGVALAFAPRSTQAFKASAAALGAHPTMSAGSPRRRFSLDVRGGARKPVTAAKQLAAVPEGGAAVEEKSLMDTLKVSSYFALWYLFNIGYNIYNKKALNVVNLPWTMATFQLFAGIPYVAALWLTGLRKAPKMTTSQIKTIAPVMLGHLGTHIGAVISLGAGAVSFTHIVKASEPVVSALFSAMFLGVVFHPIVYLSLLPIVGGVALASLKELSFTWLGFGSAMLSNCASAARAILAKSRMGGDIGENMDESNLYAVLTIMSFVTLLPLSLMVERPAKIMSVYNAAIAAGSTPGFIATTSLLSGLTYYLYNEVAFKALGAVQPVTHAVGNTVKRVVIIIASVIAFNTPISGLGALGSTIAILGTLLYSLAKNKYG